MKLVLFDLDGTLINSLGDITDAVNYTMRELGCPEHSLEAVRGFVGDGARKLIERSLPKVCEEKVEYALNMYRGVYTSNMLVKTVPYEGINELTDSLKAEGIKIGVASNKPDSDVKLINERLFGGKFDIALGADESKRRRKPSPDIVYTAIEQVGSSISKCVYIGDSEVDVATAVNSGVKCIGVSWGFRDRAMLNGADYIADSCDELKSYIELCLK